MAETLLVCSTLLVTLLYALHRGHAVRLVCHRTSKCGH